jgi:hypothetical protein
MPNDKLTELEHRLAIAECEVEKTRAQVRALQEHAHRQSRRWRDGVFGLLGLVSVFAVTRALDTQAQGKPQPLTVRAPFIVVDDQNKPIIKVDYVAHGQPRGILAFSDYNNPSAQMTVNATGDGLVVVRRAGANPFAGEGTNAVALGIDQQGNGGVRVRNHDKLVAELGNDPSGNGTLAVYDAAGKAIVKAQEKGTDPRGLVVLNAQGQIAAESTVEASGRGSVKVMNATGVGVAALLSGDTGGGLALTGPAGGKSAVSLSVDASGGKVRIFPQAGGSAQAELAAASEGGGAINVYNKSGEPVAWVEATGGGNGQFTIGRAGKVYVKAAVLENGRGMVATGPQVGGAPVGMVLPNILVGRIGK